MTQPQEKNNKQPDETPEEAKARKKRVYYIVKKVWKELLLTAERSNINDHEFYQVVRSLMLNVDNLIIQTYGIETLIALQLLVKPQDPSLIQELHDELESEDLEKIWN